MDTDCLYIVRYPDPALRRKAEPVPVVDDTVRRVADRMIDLMFEAEGVGLAAPQVGLPWRLFVAHVPPAADRSPESTPRTATAGPMVYINPVLSAHQGPPEPYEEGCLSLPGVSGDVLRPPIVTIDALNRDGRPFTQTAAGLLARCWQHECDHLDGVLIIDKMTQMARLRNRAAVRDLERAAE